MPRAWTTTAIDNGRGARQVGGGEATWLIRRYGSEMHELSISDKRMTRWRLYEDRSIISSALVATIARHCPELRGLELRVCKYVDEAATAEVVALVEGIAASRPGLLLLDQVC
mmetsp:Transcript_57576/g.141184  ORF Transcript_57576/g.141184 Transcript_57576/m.141184 type:complete len:113 (+) Transcript_57576:305-643(+)